MNRRASWCVPFLALAACNDADSSGTFLLPVDDRGIQSLLALEGGILVAAVFENGTDQNGDGDGLDPLLEIVHLESGRKTVVPDVETSAGVTCDDGFVSFLVSEGAEGRDLNGDQDALDHVLHVHDTRRGRTRNLRLATFDAVAQEGALIAVGVQEFTQGTDLNGDGDLDDGLMHVYEADLERMTRLAVEAYTGWVRVSGRRVVYLAEAAGHLVGEVQVYDASTRQLHGSERATDAVDFDGSLLGLLVPEWENGHVDLNGNGRNNDGFVELHDLESGRFRATSQNDCWILALGGDLAVVALQDVFEPGEVTVYDRLSDTFFPLDAWHSSSGAASVSGRRHAYLVEEFVAGVDLDGDGELLDQILHVFDARTGAARCSGRAAYSRPVIDERRVAYLGLAGPRAARPPSHTSVHVLEHGSRAVRDLGLMASDFRLEDGRILALTPEAWQGIDLNGDGELLDTILQVHDLRTGRTFDTRLAVDNFDGFNPIFLDGNVLAVQVGGRLKVVSLR